VDDLACGRSLLANEIRHEDGDELRVELLIEDASRHSTARRTTAAPPSAVSTSSWLATASTISRTTTSVASPSPPERSSDVPRSFTTTLAPLRASRSA
jgi:hypothetical protein